jgi:uracil phosphoribosyltransferase
MTAPFIISRQNSVFNQFMSEIRDKEIQKDRMRFRRNLERAGEILAYEMSKTFEYEDHRLETSLGDFSLSVFKEQPVLATILRAGLAMHIGLLNYFDKASNAFVSAYRKSGGDDIEIVVEYMKSPDLNGRTLIVSDPMLATGKSMIAAIEALLKNGTPSKLYIVALLASKEGLEYVQENLPMPASIWVGDVDEELNSKAYIVPGLGDAGDLAYGGD